MFLGGFHSHEERESYGSFPPRTALLKNTHTSPLKNPRRGSQKHESAGKSMNKAPRGYSRFPTCPGQGSSLAIGQLSVSVTLDLETMSLSLAVEIMKPNLKGVKVTSNLGTNREYLQQQKMPFILTNTLFPSCQFQTTTLPLNSPQSCFFSKR